MPLCQPKGQIGQRFIRQGCCRAGPGVIVGHAVDPAGLHDVSYRLPSLHAIEYGSCVFRATGLAYGAPGRQQV